MIAVVDLQNLVCHIIGTDARTDGCAGAGSEEEGYHLTRDFVIAMMEHFRRQKTIHRRYAFQIILEVHRLLRACVQRASADGTVPHEDLV